MSMMLKSAFPVHPPILKSTFLMTPFVGRSVAFTAMNQLPSLIGFSPSHLATLGLMKLWIASMLDRDATSNKRQGHSMEIELHEQRTKSANESRDGSTDEQSLEDPEEHPRDALYALRTSLNASPTQLADWIPNQVSPCLWRGVDCDPHSNVISVSLASMGFSGVLSPKLGALTMLEMLLIVQCYLLRHIWCILSCSILQDNSITDTKRIWQLDQPDLLNLENNSLSGEIPSSLGKLNNLHQLILSQNNLTGAIPKSISGLPKLFRLQLDSNCLSGRIPTHLFQLPNYNTEVGHHSFTGNRLNCGIGFSYPCASSTGEIFNILAGASNKPKTGIIVGVVGGLLSLLFLGCLLLFLWKCRHQGYKREVFVDVAVEVDRTIAFGQLKRFAWRELQLATDYFSEKNVLGEGGVGKVYRGVLGDNTKVAVKRLTDYESPGGDAAFQREVEMISVAVHRNLLRLKGSCTTPTERLLVYPFMQNLSVAYRVDAEIKSGEPVLDWPSRKRVALGTARGLEYLHEHCNQKIIHRDVKAANVLLDEDFKAVVGDFGLAKLVDVRKTSVTTQVRGTMGHIAPEYLSTGKSSERTDVFGYGIMLLELMTGRRAIDFARLEEEDDVLLLDHVR
ncbi:LOW QUALITY PROTEIN: hypothetical protein RJ639_035732 [Escallonia herrerae]|uniref:non-specific serine/threonine protein kinase n=1 Tax=Escallonia herrerae TaxID=1293975 RepID=A0AA88WN56_9ASTE|nr:LOW QUALITY PROTEIN: hypothetical protein RJ639_035732 [Escallonia herrerae]